MPAPALSLPRKLLFAALLATFTLALLLGGLEVALLLAGYGYSPHFARRASAPSGEPLWRDNRWCTAPFFSPALVRRPLPFRLPARKAPGTYRIFVLGSSAAMGDPEPSFSFARVLETMLRAAYPHQRFEVVNAAITAINSHVDRGLAADCAALEPDLFIVYEGHNEVIGPFGPAGVFAPFLQAESAVRPAAWLKTTRTGQLVSAAGRTLGGTTVAPVEWGGMQMFLQQQISADDPRLAAVRRHFAANLRAIAAAGHRAGATTLLCTVATNQRDFAPFLSRHRPGLSAATLAAWQQHVTAAEIAAHAGDLARAETEYRAALTLDDAHAELAYRLGRLVLQLGRDAEAKVLLARALDLDTLRFRTDSSLNQVIRDVATAGLPGVELVDAANGLAARSSHGVIGDEFLYEHVHLTLRGAYAVAQEIFPRVAADLARRGLASAPPAELLPLGEIRVRLGYSAHEQAMIALELVNRFRQAPFTGQADHAFRLQTWERLAQNASALLAQPDALPALRAIYERALVAAPDDWILARNAGAMLVARGAPAEALPQLERAAAWIDDDVDTLVALGWAHHALHQAAAADAAFNRARQLEPRYPNLPASPTPPASGGQ